VSCRLTTGRPDLPPGETTRIFAATPDHLGYEDYDVASQIAVSRLIRWPEPQVTDHAMNMERYTARAPEAEAAQRGSTIPGG
jgi:hypothetical protein